ncbi:MAG: hypothetical protein M3Y48_15785 [Actinomycetota bacterium]|nr:hypothetical protein [Actinomycetota bacterium]
MKILAAGVTSVLVCLATVVIGSSPAAAGPGRAEDLGSLVPVPPGVTASFAVYDRDRQDFTAVRDAHAWFRTASVVKLLIALDYLIQHDPVLDLEHATTDDRAGGMGEFAGPGQPVAAHHWDDRSGRAQHRRGIHHLPEGHDVAAGRSSDHPPVPVVSPPTPRSPT